jgi:RNA polymerase sigma factor (sigma-70 family)
VIDAREPHRSRNANNGIAKHLVLKCHPASYKNSKDRAEGIVRAPLLRQLRDGQSSREPSPAAATRPQDASLLEVFLTCRQLLSRCVARVVAPGDIEDIVQETFVRFMQAGTGRRIDHPKSFMFRTARNLALNHVQRFDNKMRRHMVDVFDEQVQLATETLEAQFESHERFANACRAISKLPGQCRHAFTLRKVYGLSQKEVAQALEMTEGNVEKHVSRGLSRCIEYMNGIDGVRRTKVMRRGT